MYDARTMTLAPSPKLASNAFARSKMSIAHRGITPGSFAFPIMLCVFPLPVCPYANIVPLKPSKRPSTSGCAMSVKTDSDSLSCAYRWSYAKMWSGSSPAAGIGLVTQMLLPLNCTISLSFKPFSVLLSGRQRTPTLILFGSPRVCGALLPSSIRENASPPFTLPIVSLSAAAGADGRSFGAD